MGLITFVSPSIETLFGYKPSEITGKPLTDFIGGDQSFLLDRVRLLRENGSMVSDYAVRARNNKIHWVRFSTKAEFRDGIFVGGVGALIDITDRKEAEIALKKSEEKYRLLAENILDVIWILNLSQNRFTYISPSVFTLRGFTAEEAMSHGISDSVNQIAFE